MLVKKVAKARFLRIGDRKLRQLARTIKGLRAEDALDRLNFSPKRKLATTLAKTVKSAVANAMEVDTGSLRLHPEDLTITTVAVDSGPIGKRLEFRAMGRVNRRQVRYSHLTVEVSGEAQVQAAKPSKRRASKVKDGEEAPASAQKDSGAEAAKKKTAKPKRKVATKRGEKKARVSKVSGAVKKTVTQRSREK